MHILSFCTPSQGTVCLPDNNDEALAASVGQIGDCRMDLILHVLWVVSKYDIFRVEIGQPSPSFTVVTDTQSQLVHIWSALLENP
jgi:hypothetical protein